jgi:hypothetical protein
MPFAAPVTNATLPLKLALFRHNLLLFALRRSPCAETGFVEGRNIAIEHRWAENQYDRFPAPI